MSRRSSACREHRVDRVGLGHVAEVQAQEVVDEAQRVVGVEEGLADALLVGVGRDHGQLREQAHHRELDVVEVVRVGAVLVVRRERGDGAREHRHRVRGVRQRREEPLEVLVEQRVATDLLVELAELVGARQRAVDEEPGDLEVGGVLGELLDRVAAIAQDALLAVDVRDLGLGGRGVHEAVVEPREARLAGEGRQVDARGAVDGRPDRELGGAAREGQGGGVGLLSVRIVHDVAHGASCDRHLRGHLLSGPGPKRPRPEYSLDVVAAHCCIRQDIGRSVGGLHRMPRQARADAPNRSAAAAIRSSVAVSERRTWPG